MSIEKYKSYWDSFQNMDAAKGKMISGLHNWEFWRNNIIDILPSFKNKKLLDLGCGIGRLYNVFTESGCIYTGADISKTMLKHFRQIYGEAYLVLITSETLPFLDNDFDIVWCWSLFPHLELEDACVMLKEIRRVLNNHGKAYISYIKTNNKNLIEGNFMEFLRHNQRFFETLITNEGFVFKELFEIPEIYDFKQALLELEIIK